MPTIAATLAAILLATAAPLIAAPTSRAVQSAPPASAPSVELDAAALAPHAARLRSIDPAADEDFSDLAPLKRAIGEARVVVLGEQSHGDGAVFLAKARLIRFLHQECGFDVLAWESGIYDCSRVHEALKAGGGEEAFDLGVFPIWTRSAQVKPTLDYVIESYKTARPLEIAGYDCQITSGQTDIYTAVVAFAESLGEGDPSAAVARQVMEGAKQHLATMSGGTTPDSKRAEQLATLSTQAAKLAGMLEQSRARLIEIHGQARTDLMLQTARSMGPFLEMMSTMAKGNPGMDAASGNARDRQMGENLAFLANELYPGRKLIVWCATFHAMHKPREVVPPGQPKLYENTVTGGQVARERLGEAMYTIGFEADHGRVGNIMRPNPWTLPPSPAGSVGAAFAGQEGNFLFLDCRALPAEHAMRRPQIGRQLGYMPASAAWPDQVDGIVFIREMFPSTMDVVAPADYALTEKP